MAWNRRMFLAAVTAVTGAAMACCQTMLRSLSEKRDVYIVPNFHPASCGWLTTFSKERSYCANSYVNHLDRVREDSNYEFVLSEINNIIAIMNFQPGRIPELKMRIAEGRVELVNGFFLESTVNLSGGEALVRLGVLGGKWYRKMYGTAPRYAWIIDTCGVHEQMPQIASGLAWKQWCIGARIQLGRACIGVFRRMAQKCSLFASVITRRPATSSPRRRC